jgi:hypothetical protein
MLGVALADLPDWIEVCTPYQPKFLCEPSTSSRVD